MLEECTISGEVKVIYKTNYLFPDLSIFARFVTEEYLRVLKSNDVFSKHSMSKPMQYSEKSKIFKGFLGDHVMGTLV